MGELGSQGVVSGAPGPSSRLSPSLSAVKGQVSKALSMPSPSASRPLMSKER